MSGKNEIVEIVEFVLSECRRMQSQLLSGDKVVPNSPEAMEFFYRIPHPTTAWSFMVCGRAADDQLNILARRALEHAGIKYQLTTKSVRDELAEIIVRKFLRELRPIDIRNVERAMAEAIRSVAKTRKTITHFLPCHLMLAQNPSSFKMGPITFLSQVAFRSRIANTLVTERSYFRQNLRVIRQATDYYRTFGWVAEVTVPDCDKITSKEVADSAVLSALNCIHLLLGYKYTQKMTIGGPGLKRDRRAELSISSENSLSYSVSYGGPGSVGFDPDWFSMFDDEGYSRALRLCGTALQSVVEQNFERNLSQRFLDAARWFGEAVREKSPAAKVVKYVTALERMLMTDEKDDITKIVSDRTAALCYDIPDKSSFDLWNSEARRAYALRSKLVHGSLSPTSLDVYEGVRLAAKVSEAAIHAALSRFGEQGLVAENVSTRRLSKWFSAIVENAKNTTENSQ